MCKWKTRVLSKHTHTPDREIFLSMHYIHLHFTYLLTYTYLLTGPTLIPQLPMVSSVSLYYCIIRLVEPECIGGTNNQLYHCRQNGRDRQYKCDR